MVARFRLKTHSIGARIFGAFVAMGLITALLGLYGLYVLGAAGQLVVDTYDKPLMATNFARSASLTFSIMDREVLRRSIAPPDETAAIDGNIDTLLSSFFDDLAVAEERALAPDERIVIEQIKAGVHAWDTLRKTHDGTTDQPLAVQSKAVVDDFDRLIELIADHSFVARRKAVWSVSYFTYTSAGAIGLALLLSAAITFVLTRRIIRPLSNAAKVADRIGDGELDTEIPEHGDDETGTLLRSMTVMQDRIRAMMEREKAVARSAENRLADAVASSDEGMMLVDASGKIVIANRQINEFFPKIAPDLSGLDFDIMLQTMQAHVLEGDEADDAPRDAAPRAQAAGLRFDREYRLADGRLIRTTSSDTHDGGFFLFLSDFTLVKQREASLREAKRLAETASNAKSSFLANMSHELRTPLNAIIGFAEMLSSEIFGALGNAKYLDYAQTIHDSGRHLLDVINGVLDFAKSEQGSMPLKTEPLDLGAILNECATMVRPQCDRASLTLNYVPSSGPIMMTGEPSKLRQIFLNLLSNAIKFTEPGGQVTIRMLSMNERTTVQIVDTGIGISLEDIPIALAPFGQIDSRLARRYEGTGLGLPLAKTLTELHGGSLEIASVPQQGTTITVTLPVDSALDGPNGKITASTAA